MVSTASGAALRIVSLSLWRMPCTSFGEASIYSSIVLNCFSLPSIRFTGPSFGSLARLFLQLDDFLDRVVLHEPRVVPIGLLERLREHDLRNRVHEVGDVALLGGPIPGHALLCRPAEQQHARRFRLLDGILFELFPPDRVMPVNVPTLRALKKAVQRDQVPHDEFPHSVHPIRKR